MQRRLGSMESALMLTRGFAPMSVAGVLRVRGAPSVDRVRGALDSLQRQQPLLRARVIAHRRGWTFDVASDVAAIPLDVISRRDDSHWTTVATEVINRNLDVETGPLLRCTYLHDANGRDAEFVFAYDHSVMDAVAAVRLYDAFVRHCAAEQPAEPTSLPLAPPTEKLLPARLSRRSRLAPMAGFLGRQVADEFAYRRDPRSPRERVRTDGRCHIVTRTLTTGATDELVSRARRRRLTTNSVVAAALLVASHRHLHPRERVSMRAMTFVDLRSTLHPPPSADVLGCYISMMRFTVPVDPADDLWSVADAFQARVREAIERDEHLFTALTARQFMRTLVTAKRMRMSTTAVSYAGSIELEERYGDIEVTGVHGFIANNGVGPVTTAFAKISGGELSWDFVFLDTDVDETTADRIADTVCESLIAPAA